MFKITIILLILYIYLFLNLGEYLDISNPPKQTDLLVCLGGGIDKNRIKKTIELYENGFLQTNTVIFTGIKNIDENINKHFEKKEVIVNNSVKNTMEEILYIKKFLIENNLSSVIFITEAPHSRRIKFFWDYFGENLENIEFSVVSSELETWDSENYYKNKINRKYAFSELTKLVYNFFIYGILENVGLKEKFESTYQKELSKSKNELNIKFH